jgi:hypothetical protein
VRSRLLTRFRYFACASCEWAERIAQNDIIALREHLEHRPSVSFDEVVETLVVPLPGQVEAIHVRSFQLCRGGAQEGA